MGDVLRVQIELSGISVDEDSREKLDEARSRHLVTFLEKAMPPERILSALSLPGALPVELSVSINSGKTNASQSEIGITAYVHSVPKVMEALRERLQDELGTALYENIDGMQAPQELSEALRLSPSDKVRFTVHFPKSAPKAVSAQDAATMGDCAPGTEYSWGKGCNSWPG